MPANALDGPAGLVQARRRALLPLVLVVISLASLALIPPMMIRRAEQARQDFVESQEAVQLLIVQIQRGIALQSAAARAYVITGDERARSDYASARASTDSSVRRLHSLVAYAGPAMVARADSLASHLRYPQGTVDSLFAGTLSRDRYPARLYIQRERLDRVFREIEILTYTLGRERSAVRAEMVAAERRARVVSALLIGLALVSALLVADLAREYWNLAMRVSQRANQQLAVIGIADRLNRVTTPEELETVLEQEETLTVPFQQAEQNLEADEAVPHLLRELVEATRRRISLSANVRENLKQFRQIADGLSVAVWLRTVGQQKFLFMNSALSRILDCPIEELYADPEAFLSAIHPDDLPRVIEARKKNVFSVEYRIMHKDGSTRWVWTRTFPVMNENGEMYRVAGISEDITEMKTATESRTRLIRGFTHDVKNPLGAADGHLALLDEGVLGELDEKQKDSVARARKSIHSALELTKDLLDIARAEAGQLEVNCALVNAGELVHRVTEEFQAKAESNGLALTVDVAEKPRLAVRTDEDRVGQILANLLSNAIKYTPRGGKVSVSAKACSGKDAPGHGEWIAIAVRDTGVGISHEQQAMLFREFTRFDSGIAEGAGIGLAISHRLAQALSGKITVESEPDVGSTFTLWLPARTQMSKQQ